MPLREEPSAPVPGLSRKPSVSQFTGLPAPSPLRKSLRAPGDPVVGSSTGATAAPSLGKRTSTSWLSKARETKALETTSKRMSTLDPGTSAFSANKRKSSEMLEAASAVLKSLDEEERATKVPKLASSSVTDAAVDSKGKGKAPSPDTVSVQPILHRGTDKFILSSFSGPSATHKSDRGRWCGNNCAGTREQCTA